MSARRKLKDEIFVRKVAELWGNGQSIAAISKALGRSVVHVRNTVERNDMRRHTDEEPPRGYARPRSD